MNSCAPATARGALDLVVGRIGTSVGDVGAHGVGEEERVLEHDADLAPHGVERDVAHVDAVDADRAVLHVVEAGEEEAHRRLARARRPDQRDRLARRDPQREVAQHRLRPQVAVADVVERDLADDRHEVGARRALGDEGVGVDQLEDPVGAGAGLLGDRHHPREHAHRREQLHEVRGEGEERADADLALDGEPAAEREHRDLPERRDRLQRRLVARLQAHRAHPRPVQVLGGVGEARRARGPPARSPSRRARR